MWQLHYSNNFSKKRKKIASFIPGSGSAATCTFSTRTVLAGAASVGDGGNGCIAFKEKVFKKEKLKVQKIILATRALLASHRVERRVNFVR